MPAPSDWQSVFEGADIAMTNDNSNQATSISRQMLALTQQFVLLETFDSAIKAANASTFRMQ